MAKKRKRPGSSRLEQGSSPLDSIPEAGKGLNQLRLLVLGIFALTALPFLFRVAILLPNSGVNLPYPLPHLIGYAFFTSLAALGLLTTLVARRPRFPHGLGSLIGVILSFLGLMGCLTELVASMDPSYLHNQAYGIFN